MAAIDTTLGAEDLGQYEREAAAGRELTGAKRATKSKEGTGGGHGIEDAATKYAKEVAKKMTLRIINWASSAAVVGVVVPYIVQSIQAIAGNLMDSKWIPKLDWWEFILWLILVVSVFMAMIALVIFMTSVAVFTNPVILGKALWDSWFGS